MTTFVPKAAILDFDGTLVHRDHSSLLAELNGKQAETDKLNADFHAGLLSGVVGLTKQIENLVGLHIADVISAVSAVDHLMPGASDLLTYFRTHDVITIVASGSILPVLEHYRRVLGFDHAVGSAVAVEHDVIVGLDSLRPILDGFKFNGCDAILEKLDISWDDVVAIGDSPAEREVFSHAGLSIAINPKGDIGSLADYIIENDLRQAIEILERARRDDSDVPA